MLRVGVCGKETQNMALTKKTVGELEALRAKWNLDSKTAQKNRTKYVLNRARADVVALFAAVGAEASPEVITEWQSRSLDAVAGIGTHAEVAEAAVAVAVNAVQAAFSDYPEGSLFHHVGVSVAEEVVAVAEEALGVELTGAVDIVSVDTGSLEIAPEVAEVGGAPDISPKHMLDWVKKLGVGAGILLIGVSGVGLTNPSVSAYASTADFRVETGESVAVQTFASASASGSDAGVVAGVVDRGEYGVSYNFGTGFVPTGLTATDGVGAGVGEAAFRAALSQVGVPYVFGGASPSGFDCSGLTMWAYGTQGVSLGHGVSIQSGQGFEVSRAEARLGDLVVMNGHNGFWAGPGMILDAPRPGGVVSVRPLWTDSYWIIRVTG
ncbi:MAG: C40 family peptidase [Cetobacterium sp.]